MTQAQIDKLISAGKFPEMTKQKTLVETHISWVIICDHYVYKIKKPLKYSFLDFSTIALRKYFCQRELELNLQIAEKIYLAVLPIYNANGVYTIGGTQGMEVDCTLKMCKMDPERQMDVLLAKNMVSQSDIRELAEYIMNFHQSATIVYGANWQEIRDKFNAIAEENEFLSKNMGKSYGKIIELAIATSNAFLDKNKNLFKARLEEGFFRDCHGDLHTRNIFLLPTPQPFDRIEFNDSFRQIDLLDEVAFLCMDLDALGRKDLADLFMVSYNQFLPVMRNNGEQQLFIYYKCYRASVRAKVNSLRAKGALDDRARAQALSEVRRYLRLIKTYLDQLVPVPEE